ncbi:MAG TPA: fibronectin type III domain-containing protein [Thermoanaerobaculia bacterium]
MSETPEAQTPGEAGREKTPTTPALLPRANVRGGTLFGGVDRLPAEAAPPLLQLVQAKAGQPVPPAVQQAAEAAFLKVVSQIKAGAVSLPPSKALDEVLSANDDQLRALFARNIPRVRALLDQAKKFTPSPGKKPSGARPKIAPLDLPLVTPDAPTNVTAGAGNASALVQWTAPAQTVTTYTVTPFVGTTAQAPTTVPGLTPSALVLGLTNGTTYTFRVKATNLAGTSPNSAPSNAVTPAVASTSTPFLPTLPALSAAPVLQLDPAAETARDLLAEAGRIGAKWRFEYLKAQALRAAQESLAYETHITTLMQMTISKATAAEQILNATLRDAAARLDAIDTSVAQLSGLPAVDALVGPLADAASDALLLPRFLLFLARTSPIDFWIGLFEALISDLASALFSDTDFSRTKAFLGKAFSDDLDGVRTGVQQAVTDLLQRLDDEVDQIIAPLKKAIAEVVGGTSKAMADVFEAFDLPLLMSPPAPGSTFDVPDGDPLTQHAQELLSEVEKQADLIKQAIRDRLEPLLGSTSDKFVELAVIYLVIPILAFLVISLAGGPFSAALLAAVVLIAAQELIHLLLKWLTGPLLNKVDEVRRLANGLIAQLNRLFAQQASLAQNLSPELILEMLANQVRELRDLLPDEFVREASALLQAARDVVLRDGLELALGAEQALGIEHGTAFDVIRDQYLSLLPAATQLPAGTDPSLFAGAALLRDLGRLEQQRTSLQEGRETELTIRLSLLRLLGGDPLNLVATPGELPRFLSTREAVVSLTESELVDDRYPGIYRALIKEVRVAGLFNALPLGSTTGGVPISVTHLGTSRTRIKRGANPAAPPLKLPECVHLTEEDFALQAADQTALETMVRSAFQTVPLATRRVYLLALFVEILFGLPDAIGLSFQQASVALVPGAVAARISSVLDVGGFVDPASCRQRAEQILRAMSWTNIIGLLLDGTTVANLDQPPPFSNLAPAITQVAQALRTGLQGSTDLRPGLQDVAAEAYRAAVEAFQHRIGKWGGAYLEEDPDPQVRSLGFATLVRPQEAETALFTLFPPAPATAVSAGVPPSAADGAPVGAVPPLQYRPFENRGIDGRLLLRLEPGADGIAQLSDNLSDVVIDVVVRALYDPDLAATVRASRRQRRSLLGLVGTLPALARTILIPGTRPELQAATGDVRTVHFSLRAQRDRAIDTWTAALQLDPTLVPTIAALGPLTRLTPDQPYTPLKPLAGTPLNAAVSLSSTALTKLTEPALLAVEHTVGIGLADLGFPSNVLNAGFPILEDAKLLGLGIAVIPTQDGVRPPGTLADATEPIGLTLKVDSLLGPLLPGFGTAAPLKQRLALTPFSTATGSPSVRLADIFNAATPPAITATIPAAAFDAPQRVYDVIFSFTFTVPTLLAATALEAVR